MVNVLLNGCCGKMGQVITKLAQTQDDVRIAAGIDIQNNIKSSYRIYSDPYKCTENIDVIIDFSHPSALETLLKFAVDKRLPIVIATTGLSENQIEKIYSVSKKIPVFFSANMSLGINLLIDLVKKAARVLESSFDIEIIEKHHNQKIDAPSGTALTIADAINSVLNNKLRYVYDRHINRVKRSKDEIGIHALRGGTITGEHSVIFAGNDEIIEIKHIAASKEIFAEGALKAAVFLHNKKCGFYSMDDLLG